MQFKTVTNINTGETTDSYIVNAKEIEIIKREVTKQDVVLDIGANIGFLTTILAEQAKYVYAFEPSPYNFEQLVENTKQFEHINLFKMALSDKENYFSTLYLCPQDNGMNRLYPSKWCEGGKIVNNVYTTTLDSLSWIWISKGMETSFIKLDVEGYEYYVIQGMRKLLKRNHPTILMEFHPPSIQESGAKPEHIYLFMKYDLGYQDPINVNTDEIIPSYQELDKQTRDTPAVNILWKYNTK